MIFGMQTTIDVTNDLWKDLRTQLLEEKSGDTVTVRVLQLGKPTAHTGRVYDKVSFQKTVDAFNKKEVAFGQFGQSMSMGVGIDLTQVSHSTSNLRINENDEVVVDIKVLNTPYGKELKTLMENEIGRFGPRMQGTYNEETKQFDDIELIAIDFLSN